MFVEGMDLGWMISDLEVHGKRDFQTCRTHTWNIKMLECESLQQGGIGNGGIFCPLLNRGGNVQRIISGWTSYFFWCIISIFYMLCLYMAFQHTCRPGFVLTDLTGELFIVVGLFLPEVFSFLDFLVFSIWGFLPEASHYHSVQWIWYGCSNRAHQLYRGGVTCSTCKAWGVSFCRILMCNLCFGRYLQYGVFCTYS